MHVYKQPYTNTRAVGARTVGVFLVFNRSVLRSPGIITINFQSLTSVAASIRCKADAACV